MIESILISALTMACGGLMTYVIGKKLTSTNRILDISDVLIDEITQNAEMQKKLYLVGVLIGNGIKAGVGLSKGRGKFKLEDLIGNAIGQMFFKGGQGQEQQQMDKIDFGNLNK